MPRTSLSKILLFCYVVTNHGSNFIVQALKDEPITIYGEGEQTRSFCYVSDLIEGIYALVQTGDEITGPMNLGNPVEFTVKELALKVLEMTDSSSPLLFYPLPQDDPKKRQPEITFARKILNWEPKKALDVGLEKTIEYFQSKLTLKKDA